jgi:hypothetical protein
MDAYNFFRDVFFPGNMEKTVSAMGVEGNRKYINLAIT